MQLSERAREIQREYKKKWREKNKDKVRESNRRYWEKKAAGVNNETEKDQS